VVVAAVVEVVVASIVAKKVIDHLNVQNQKRLAAVQVVAVENDQVKILS
jgi:hypothetical protein